MLDPDNTPGDAKPLRPLALPRGTPPVWMMVAGTILILAFAPADQPLSNWLTSDPVRNQLRSLIGGLLALGFYFTLGAILMQFPNRRRLIIGMIVPALASTAILHALKFAIGRARPRLDDGPHGPWHFQPFSGADDCDAFPSGHATALGTAALLLGLYFPRARWVFYTLALLVGLERIYNNWHWPSDVIAGYVLAAAVVYACVRLGGTKFYSRDFSAAGT
jgi:membrane-associated phospholipid phosphatase